MCQPDSSQLPMARFRGSDRICVSTVCCAPPSHSGAQTNPIRHSASTTYTHTHTSPKARSHQPVERQPADDSHFRFSICISRASLPVVQVARLLQGTACGLQTNVKVDQSPPERTAGEGNGLSVPTVEKDMFCLSNPLRLISPPPFSPIGNVRSGSKRCRDNSVITAKYQRHNFVVTLWQLGQPVCLLGGHCWSRRTRAIDARTRCTYNLLLRAEPVTTPPAAAASQSHLLHRHATGNSSLRLRAAWSPGRVINISTIFALVEEQSFVCVCKIDTVAERFSDRHASETFSLALRSARFKGLS